ncbi:MAG: hypothetical protein MJZ66_04675 [Bacteroidales bacterium]|nr:hypothetical protein [Bacteroidales bacterium]
MEWFENLPLQCPPSDAVACDGNFYRIANGNPAESEDFFSQRKMNPNKEFKGVDECIARAISVFLDKSDAERIMKLPKFKNATLALVFLFPKDGVIKKTFKNSHYSWWRSNDFNVEQAKIIEL